MAHSDFATEYDIRFNTNKSVAMRIGVRYNAVCEPLSCNKLMFFSIGKISWYNFIIR